MIAGGRAGGGQPLADQLAAQRRAVERAMVQGRRWYLRSAVMMVIGIVAAWRGGQIHYTLGVVMVLLAGIGISLGRSVRRSAAASLEKIDLMEKQRGAP